MARISGGEALVRCLLQEGVRCVFGIPGGQLLPFIDAIARVGEPQGLRYVMTRHESAAAHMADAWARVTGEPAVCSGTIGPGAANLVPGVWVAREDSVPMIVITPQIHTHRSYPFRGSQQQLDQHHLFASITKWSAVVQQWERIPELVQRAFRVAVSGRPGPVHLDIPVDVMFETREEDALPIHPPARYRATQGSAAPPNLVNEVARQIVQAQRPVLHPGLGVLRGGAWEPLRSLAEHLKIPVSPTISARGVLSEEHELGLIAVGGGGLFANMGADLVVAVGATFWELDFWGRPPFWGPAGAQQVIQIDADPTRIGLNRPVDLALVGDAREVLQQLVDAVKELTPARESSEWAMRCKTQERESLKALEPALRTEATPIHPLRLIGEVRRFFGPETILVVDGGNIAVWAAMGTRVGGPRQFLGAHHTGHLGVGLPFALGAKMAHPDRPVVVLHGDGSFMLSCHELETAARLELPVIDVIGNDRAWGMIKAGQAKAFGERFCGVDFTDVRYDLLAQAMGCHGERVTVPEEIHPALDRAVASGKPAVLDVYLDATANLNPPLLDLLNSIWLEGCEK
jgi:acetolactate synthase I/II/III large subunit